MYQESIGRELFIGDLASICQEEHIRILFKCHGFDIVDVKIMRGNRSMSSLNYGFVQMKTCQDASLAIQALDNFLYYGRRIRLNWASVNSDIKKTNESVNSVYVRFQTKQVYSIVSLVFYF
jgi:RNA recognition motif-containing protein